MSIAVSRHGLTRCASCQAHMRIAETVATSACPFCGARLKRLPKRAMSGLLSGGRSGLLAASLMGLTALTGCGDEDEGRDATDAAQTYDTNDASDTNATDTTDAPDSTPSDVYGLPPDTAEETDTASDVAPDAAYGLPPDSNQPD